MIDATVEKFAKELRISLIALFTPLYIIFLIVCIFYETGNTTTLKIFFHYINETAFHVVGILCIIISLWKIFKNSASRKLARQKFALLFGETENDSVILNEAGYLILMSEKEIQKKLMQFSMDANEIMIFAGDADFLIQNQNIRSEQFDEIKKFGSNCKLLVNENLNVDISLLKELSDNNVQIKLYPKSKPNIGLRGRIKVTADGRSAMLFDKVKGNFQTQEFKNIYLLNMLCKEYEDIFKVGRNPFIRYIFFDLAGVYCDGDIEFFLQEIKTSCDIVIENKNSNYLCVDDRLNLNTENFTIVNYVEEKSGQSLSFEKKKLITNAWNNTWTLNTKMRDLAYALKENGYTIAVCSNCDEDNGEKYLIRNYFNGFDRFFSYEMKKLKPSVEYFQSILDTYKCKSYECLFIDDHEKNIDAAKNLGFCTIKVARDHNQDEKVQKLLNQFSKLSINV